MKIKEDCNSLPLVDNDMNIKSLVENIEKIILNNEINIPKILPLINKYYLIPGNSVGGNLHIFFDDGNIDNDSINYCKKIAIECNDFITQKLADLLLLCSKTQRKKLCYLKNKKL